MPTASTKTAPLRPLPVTLLSGFLGSGKTSLLKHILTEKDHKMRVAVIVNEITSENLDVVALQGAKLIQSEEKVVEMSNGCICCTLRLDLMRQLRELHATQAFDAALIESSGIAEPMEVAESFFVPPPEEEEGDVSPGASTAAGPSRGVLQAVTPLDNCITVVDATTVMDFMRSDLSTAAMQAGGAEAPPSDVRSVSQLFVDQLEFANVILLNKTDLLPKGEQQKAGGPTIDALTALIRRINPTAEIVPTVHSRVPLDKLLRTQNFTEAFATAASKWMRDEVVAGGAGHVPETLEYGISSCLFKSFRPFHPKRLHDWLTRYFVLQELSIVDTDAHNGGPSPSQTCGSGATPAPADLPADLAERVARRRARYGDVFRSKGYVYMGTFQRHDIFGTWSQTGNVLNFFSGGYWDEDFPDVDGAAAGGQKGQKAGAKRGRRVPPKPRQLLSFVGQDLNKAVLLQDLEALLLTKAEMRQFDKALETGKDILEDPFLPWQQDGDESADEDDHHVHHDGCSHK